MEYSGSRTSALSEHTCAIAKASRAYHEAERRGAPRDERMKLLEAWRDAIRVIQIDLYSASSPPKRTD